MTRWWPGEEWRGRAWGEGSRAGEGGEAPPRPGGSRHQNSQGKEEQGAGNTHPEGELGGLTLGAPCPGLGTRQPGRSVPFPAEPQLAPTFPLDLTGSLRAPRG